MEKKKIAIALQGGGAHGAFAWGVMDAFLEDGRFDILGVSGTSAGGMNAAAIVQGLIQGGNVKARETLYEYWKGVSELAKKIGVMGPTPFDKAMGNYNLDHAPGFMFMSALQGMMSPYEYNPTNANPFFDFLKDFFDFDVVRNSQQRRIFLGTTHVATGRKKIFTNKDFCADVLLASACLPFLFQAVQIEGEYYWDGGFIANPAIYPLINECACRDIFVIQLTRTHCPDLPKTKSEIVDRLKEITYNGCLVNEMRAIYFITKLIDMGKFKEGAMKRLNIHVVKNEDTFKNLNLSSAMNTDWDFLTFLRDEGRKTAARWIEKNFDKVGSEEGTIDEEMFRDFVS